jgi:gas vesicle protein
MAENRGGGSDELVYFLIGVGIGAVTASLFAPKAGSERRSEIAPATRNGVDYAHDTQRHIGERASDLTARGRMAVSDLTDGDKELIKSQKAQLTAAVGAGK